MLHEAATGAMRDLDRLAEARSPGGGPQQALTIERDLIQRVLHQDAPSSEDFLIGLPAPSALADGHRFGGLCRIP